MVISGDFGSLNIGCNNCVWWRQRDQLFHLSNFLDLPRWKKVIKLFAVWIGLLFIFGLIFEIILRIKSEDNNTVEHEITAEFGLWRKANQSVETKKECYHAKDILINSFGMRGSEPKAGKKKIAYFGDSMLEGFQVSDSVHFLGKLNIKSDSIEHLNFGINSIGPTSQYFIYRHFSELFEFEKVVFCIYLGNDLLNSSLELETEVNGGNRGYLPHFRFMEDGSIRPDKDYSSLKKLSFLKKSRVLKKLNELRHEIRKKRLAKNLTAAFIPWTIRSADSTTS